MTNVSGKTQEAGWQEHVSIGPPFLEMGGTIIDHAAKRGWVIRAYGRHHALKPDTKFMWPHGPKAGGGELDLRTYTTISPRGDFTAQRMEGKTAWFTAINPRMRLLIGYIWDPAVLPWLDIWTECRSVPVAPWNGQAVACGLEFGLAPTTERPLPKQVLGAPTKAIMQAGGKLSTVFHSFITEIPADCTGVREVKMEGDNVVISFVSPETSLAIS
jgi:hypothetical protein